MISFNAAKPNRCIMTNRLTKQTGEDPHDGIVQWSGCGCADGCAGGCADHPNRFPRPTIPPQLPAHCRPLKKPPDIVKESKRMGIQQMICMFQLKNCMKELNVELTNNPIRFTVSTQFQTMYVCSCRPLACQRKTCLCLRLRRLFPGCVRVPSLTLPGILSLFISAWLAAPSAD